MINKTGTKRLKIANTGIITGEIKGNKNESNRKTASKVFAKYNILSKKDRFFIYLLPCLNKNSFSALVSVS